MGNEMAPLPDSICERLKHFPNFFWWPHLTILTGSPAIGSKIRTKALSCQTPAVFMENLIIQFLLSSSLLDLVLVVGPLLNTAGDPLGGSGVGTGGDRPLEHPPPTHTLTHAQS